MLSILIWLIFIAFLFYVSNKIIRTSSIRLRLDFVHDVLTVHVIILGYHVKLCSPARLCSILVLYYRSHVDKSEHTTVQTVRQSTKISDVTEVKPVLLKQDC